MAKITPAPTSATLSAVFGSGDTGINDAALRDAQRQSFEPREIYYTQTTDQGLASRRSKHVVRTHAEVAAANVGDALLGDGLSLRAPMAGQCENDQFTYSTDIFGKQRS